ncbi:class I SAM-dependent methyltransferase [Mesorhizobium sp. BR1-1-16]|uniref:class I SAM-dependent methyltransferase n=1 Tax=Mesorhizobium sp. BR1-1-16 TaxID=2876653 RepID=UPI001CCE5E39|nr:class I SAM-dependent methyltransferase [Mesorhizobium sp. BR1-1-16]MBZ9939229.1 class I SAM-dependent methyltransferase [Mesorhizobium sp. BR1-1-16]
MEEESKLARPAPMEGHGGYNSRSAVQASTASPALPRLERAAVDVPLSPGKGAIVVADYGASQGRNSLMPMSIAVRRLRQRLETGRAISVVHTDLADNDFSALFELLNTDPESYLKQDQGAFASAIGRSFYEQILPDDSVTLGWCAWSVQWLSRTPVAIPDHVQVAYSKDDATRAAFAAQAADDWLVFLKHRRRELRPGGRLVILTMARTDDGDFGYGPLLTAMYDALRELVTEGVVQQEEAARMAIPTVGRTRAEFAAPFTSGEVSGLELEHIEIFEGDDAIWRDFLADGNATAFGARWAAFSRASVLPTLSRDLSQGASAERVRGFMDRMEAGMAARLAVGPDRTLMPLAIIVVAAAEEADPGPQTA